DDLVTGVQTCALPIFLAAALAGAKAGDRLLVVSYGDGADAFLFEASAVAERLEGRRGAAWHLGRRAELPSYDIYLRFRQLLRARSEERRVGKDGRSRR